MLTSGKTLLYAKVCIRVREIRIVAFPHPEAPSLSILRMRKYKSAEGFAQLGERVIPHADWAHAWRMAAADL